MPDPYTLTSDTVKKPPVSLGHKLKYLGPGFILSASIVGSGELIATTTLGAKAGFVTLWVILLSCLVKVIFQLEFGKHTILTGETPMKAFNRLPGPSAGRSNWAIWLFFILINLKLLQAGGILGGVAIILHISFPAVPVMTWAFGVAFVVALMIFRGYYRFIEGLSVLMIAGFTIFTFIALYFLSQTPYQISGQDLFSGLQFQLPSETVPFAVAAFGITGAAGDEIISYNYWCLEKGFAAYVGPPDNSPARQARARGWIKMMHLDAIFSMIVYTLVTAGFYLLGASVLYARGEIPQGFQMIETLSGMYTESLGPGARTFFLAGAFTVLFSTLFSVLAGRTRVYSDLFGQIGWIDFRDPKQRLKAIAWLAWVIPGVWALIFVFIQLPVVLVLIGGVVSSMILVLVIFATIYFRYGQQGPRVKAYDLVFWLCILIIGSAGVFGLVQMV